MYESVGIGCPLRTGFITALCRGIHATLRLKTSRGVIIDNNRLGIHQVTDIDTHTWVKHLSGDIRFIIFAGNTSPLENGQLPVEGLHFSLIRATLSYDLETNCLDITPTEATQFPPCPPGVTAWNHFSQWAHGTGFGSLKVDRDARTQLLELIQAHSFNETSAYYIAPLDTRLYILWHWVSASYTVEFGLPLALPQGHQSASETLCSNTIKHMRIPSHRISLDKEVLRYLISDRMVFPPGTDNISYASIESDTDSCSYPSDNELTDSEPDTEPFDWEVIKTFTDELRTSIDKYGSVVPCVNGTYLDDALWVTNYTIECSNVRELLMQLKSSTYWHDRAQDSFLTLLPGRHFNNHYQLRCFVLEHELVCIEQLFVHENFEFMAKDAHGLVTLLKQFSLPILNLVTTNAIFDVTISRELTGPRLVDIYPFGAVADGLLHLEDVYHFYYTRVKDGIEPSDKVDMDIIDGVLVVFVGCNASRLKKHAWCPKDVGNLSFSTPDDLIDYLRFQTSESS